MYVTRILIYYLLVTYLLTYFFVLWPTYSLGLLYLLHSAAIL